MNIPEEFLQLTLRQVLNLQIPRRRPGPASVRQLRLALRRVLSRSPPTMPPSLPSSESGSRSSSTSFRLTSFSRHPRRLGTGVGGAIADRSEICPSAP